MAFPNSGAAARLGSYASVQDLSDEIILEIFESVLLGPTELALVCLVCKRLHRIAAVLLYKKITVLGDLNLHKFLRSILHDDSLGELVKDLTLAWDGDMDLKLFDTGGYFQEPPVNTEDEDVKILADAAGLRSVDPEILQSLAQGSESAKAIVLISSLPNLRALSIQPPSTMKLFDTHFARLATDGSSLSNLQGFERLWHDIEYGFKLGLLFPVMVIPSLKTLWGYRACNEPGYVEEGDHPGDGISNITHLALMQSKITGEHLASILRIPMALEYFSFSDGDANVAWGFPTREEFGNGLAYVSRTLVSLSIEWDNDTNYDLDCDHTTLGSLGDFKRLRIISIVFDVLLGIDPEEAVDLASVLPQSIEQLFFIKGHNGTWKDADYLHSIERLLQAKSGWTFTALTTVGMRPDPELLAPLLNLAAGKGITLASHDDWVTRYRSKTFEIEWHPFPEEMIE